MGKSSDTFWRLESLSGSLAALLQHCLDLPRRLAPHANEAIRTTLSRASSVQPAWLGSRKGVHANCKAFDTLEASCARTCSSSERYLHARCLQRMTQFVPWLRSPMELPVAQVAQSLSILTPTQRASDS